MHSVAEVDLTIKDLSDRTGLSPRMLNIYRADAEVRLGRKLGYKQGRTTYFQPEDVQEILRQRDTGNPRSSQNFRETTPISPDFSNTNNQAENDILTGMDAIVASGDQNAIAIGQALGQRWNQLMWASAIQTMQGGMVQMQQQFSELHTSVSLELQQPQLPGNSLETHSLPES